MNDRDTIAFIGGGNMARSLVAGLRAGGMPSASIRVAEPVAGLRDALHRDFGVAVFAENTVALAGAGTWVFAIKPQLLRQVCQALAGTALRARPLVVSIAAGITTVQLERWLSGATAIVRAMPNTPAASGAGITGLYANPHVDAVDRQGTERLLGAVGEIAWLADEAMMDAVTAVSGSGPAYLYLLAEAMQSAAMAEGLPADAARNLVLPTLLGAARMLIEDGAEPAALRARVTSPAGTTHAAIATFEAGGFSSLVARSIHAAVERARELAAAND